MLTEDIKQQLITTINAQLHTDFIMLFGSFAKGTVRQDSDIDLAYFSKHALSSYERFMLAGDLATIAGQEVDLVDLKQIDTVLTMQIFSEGKVIYQETTRNSHAKKCVLIVCTLLYVSSARRLLSRLKNEGVSLAMNDVILNKTATIERCVKRIHEVYAGNPINLADFTKQDSIVLNI